MNTAVTGGCGNHRRGTENGISLKIGIFRNVPLSASSPYRAYSGPARAWGGTLFAVRDGGRTRVMSVGSRAAACMPPDRAACGSNCECLALAAKLGSVTHVLVLMCHL